MWGLFAAGAYFAVQGRWLMILIMGLLFTAFSLGTAFVRWSRFSYRVSDDQIRIDSGVISRVHRSISFDRIQDVDITQGPLARLLGVAKVRFETGGGGGGAEDGVLDAITRDDAEKLRALIRARRSGAAAVSTVEEAPDESTPVYAMNMRRLVLAGLFNFSLALFAGLFGITQTMGDVVGFDPFRRSFWLQLLSAGTPIADFLLAHRIVAAAGGLLILGLVGLLTGVVRTTLRDFGFRVDRTEAGLRRRRGLLTRTDVTLPVARVQAAVVATGPVRDRFGWRELSFQNLARDEGGKGNHILAPLATDAELDRIVAELGWRPLSRADDWQPVSTAYIWTRLLWLAPLLLAAGFQALFVPWVGIAGATLILGAMATRYLSWRRTRYALDGDRLLVRTGWWRRRAIVLPISKIQSVDLSEDPIGRLFGTASLQFGVAGGGLYPGHEVPALARETARQLRNRLLSVAA
jgi:putative membrane protein